MEENELTIPAEPRDSARLLVVRDGGFEDRIIRDLPDFLQPGDALVFNDTRVIPARLSGRRERTGAEGETLTVAVEATLHHRDRDPVETLTLARKVTSTVGLAEVVPVRRNGEQAEPLAMKYLPLSSLARSDGWFLVPADSEGYSEGSAVQVKPWP